MNIHCGFFCMDYFVRSQWIHLRMVLAVIPLLTLPGCEVTDLNISWNFMSRDGIRKLTRHIKDGGSMVGVP